MKIDTDYCGKLAVKYVKLVNFFHCARVGKLPCMSEYIVLQCVSILYCVLTSEGDYGNNV